ncbi:10187_t:CDS:2 [Gigaspora margarita]|uniref:10187_t:CDS:1 n=1 Tax=Gigaspora margarita TaxID=4874 RepID=A0ABN7V1E9_GIGMA|nr:10187_t:CDS:2 [Gigaspora margarita]
MLNFDFEKVCPVSLSILNIYAYKNINKKIKYLNACRYTEPGYVDQVAK